jgi:hypothetical protein
MSHPTEPGAPPKAEPEAPPDAAGAPDTKGRAKPDRAIQNEVLEEGLPPKYQTERPGQGEEGR